jgi:hypothetical protein
MRKLLTRLAVVMAIAGTALALIPAPAKAVVCETAPRPIYAYLGPIQDEIYYTCQYLP